MSAAGERARLFVALELPGEVRDSLGEWRNEVVAEVAGLRPVAVESLHVTLCFLGSVAVASVDAVASACSVVVGMPAASLRVSGGIWLPPRLSFTQPLRRPGDGGLSPRFDFHGASWRTNTCVHNFATSVA